jgi:hypothetical protein
MIYTYFDELINQSLAVVNGDMWQYCILQPDTHANEELHRQRNTLS